MTYPRLAHTATLLKSGSVLVDGGWSTQTGGTESSAELYDPVANTWSSAGSPAARDQQPAVLLSNGKVLVVGGEDGSHNPLAIAELYNPKTNTWQTAPSMTYPRYRTSAVLLDNGLVLVPGGTDGPPFGFAGGLNVAELYNPNTHSRTIGPSMPFASNFFTVNVLRDGYVLLAGGGDNGALSSTQLYVPAPF